MRKCAVKNCPNHADMGELYCYDCIGEATGEYVSLVQIILSLLGIKPLPKFHPRSFNDRES
jgi:hypothetical protein